MTAKPGDIGIVEHRLYPSIFEIVRVVRGSPAWNVERWDGDWRPAKEREVRTWLPLPADSDVAATMTAIRRLGDKRAERVAEAAQRIKDAEAEYRREVSALSINPTP